MVRAPDPIFAARSQIAIHSRKGKHANPDKVRAARRELALAKLERYVAETVEDLAPLSAKERARITTKLTKDSVGR